MDAFCRSFLTWRKLKRDDEAIVRTRAFWPLQFGVQRVQDVELHGFEETVALVFKYNRNNHLAAILQVPLDVIHLENTQNR